MIRKFCGTCHEYSYSAYGGGKWTCAYCGRDLTDQEVEQIETAHSRRDNRFDNSRQSVFHSKNRDRLDRL